MILYVMVILLAVAVTKAYCKLAKESIKYVKRIGE